MKNYISIIDEREGQQKAEDAGSMIMYYDLSTALGTLKGFSVPNYEDPFRAPTIYVSRQQVEKLINRGIEA